MRLKIRHTTRYRFDPPARFGLQQVRKTPKDGHGQWVINWSTTLTGATRQLSYEDHHHNVVELISFDRDVSEVEITSEGEMEIQDNAGVIGRHTGPSPLWLYEQVTPRTTAGPGVKALLKKVEGADALSRLHALSAMVGETVAYEVGASQPDWTAEDALSAGKGVCQDHTHVFIAAARAMGLPARYVSGYLMLDDRVDQDAMHAWAEAHVDGLGWVGFDPSNAISPDMRYVRVATGLDYSEASPVHGLRMGPGAELLDVQIAVAQQ